MDTIPINEWFRLFYHYEDSSKNRISIIEYDPLLNFNHFFSYAWIQLPSLKIFFD